MPHSSDDPLSNRSSAGVPSARPAHGQESEPTSPSRPDPPAEDASIESDRQVPIADSREAPRLPSRRRRRRYRWPRPPDRDEATAARQSQAEPPATATDVPQSDDVPAVPANTVGPRRRRRRRRGPPRAPGTAEVIPGGAAEAAEHPPESSLDGASASDAGLRQDRSHEQPGYRRRRRRPPRPAAATAAAAGDPATGREDTTSRAPSDRPPPFRGPRNREVRNRRSEERLSERAPAGRDRRSPDRRASGRGGPRAGDRRRARDRDAPRNKPEQRLYALEAIVDRGFEDVVDAAEDNLTRRVHWTITKRTVADQESGKPISTTYVLKRDGVDTEFPGLGAARLAANKTIVHPEKLTVSKAEHAAERSATKK